jgi:EAL domain-containing protein (putative c-di-GMP-specific phosphodiesterase class I)
VDRVAGVLAETGLPPARLELELTERELVEDLDGSLATLESLRALGVTIVLDDFGTGYSSLAYLKRLPVDKLKIDRSFVASLPASGADRAICRTIVSLSQGLGLGVVAEGIETPGQAAALHADGCSLGQGFLFGRPMPALPAAAGRPARMQN